MEYYRSGDRVGGYPIGPELEEDDPFGAPSEIDGGFRPGGDYIRQGYGLPGYADDGYDRGRLLGGEYVVAAPEYYGAERPNGYGYGREGYPPSAYRQQQQIIVQPPVEYVEAWPSDLGMGLRDSHFVDARHSTDYGAGYGRSDLACYGGAPG